MGKLKKNKRLGRGAVRPGPLGDQIVFEETAQPTDRRKVRAPRKDEDDEFVEGAMGHTILKQSLAQLQELEDEVSETAGEKEHKEQLVTEGTTISLGDDDSGDEEENKSIAPFSVDRVVEDFEKELNVTTEDRKILEHFIKKDAGPQRTLADIFKDKITEKHTEIMSHADTSSIGTSNISPEVERMCSDMGKVLAKYRHGRLPKMFKIIPKMQTWEELVYLTNPDKWSAAAMYQATRIFVSNLKEPMAQRFFNLVLLPRVRDDIAFYKRLNFHLYQALNKALFKPGAFFKGILLPLCMNGNCTLREAIIIGSVIAKNHIPILHSSAALLKVAEMDYTGPSSIFLRIFFEKKYALPYRVVDACVYHFLKFQSDSRDLPVLWHQSLLVFVQRYKGDLSYDQKDAIMELLRFHSHHKITPEIRRELQNSKCRGENEEPAVEAAAEQRSS